MGLGVLIYSDPAEDGEVIEKNGLKPYPEGPARHPLSVQRGSVQKLASYPGDPLTPGQPVCFLLRGVFPFFYVKLI